MPLGHLEHIDKVPTVHKPFGVVNRKNEIDKRNYNLKNKLISYTLKSGVENQ